MTDTGDRPSEILDLGGSRRAERGSARSLPPLYLGAPPPPEDNGDIRSTRGQWLLVAVIAAAGVVAGALGANARNDAAELAAAESAVRVIAGAPQVEGFPTPLDVRFPLLNAGPLDIEVLWARPKGWQLPEDADRRTIRLPPDTWVTVASVAVPDCSRPTGGTVEVSVRTKAREQVVELDVPDPRVLAEASRQACEAGPQVGAYVQEVELVTSARPDTLTMRLHMRSYDPGIGFTLIELNASAPGVRMIDTSVPVEFQPGARASLVDVTWEIVDCELTGILGDVQLGLSFNDAEGRFQSDRTSLPGRGVAELARFALRQCGPS